MSKDTQRIRVLSPASVEGRHYARGDHEAPAKDAAALIGAARAYYLPERGAAKKAAKKATKA